MGTVAYNPDDPTQTGFLSALALGETGNSSYAAHEGFGGIDLSNAPTDKFGFPIQGAGTNVSSAAGTYQFLKGTYDDVAGQIGLHDFSQSSQNEAAWVYAQQQYNAKTGGSLYDALKAGNFQQIQSALVSIWPSVTGNGAAPQGLAASLAGGRGANVPFPVLTEARQIMQIARGLVVRRDYLGISKTGLNGSALSPSGGLS